MRYEQLSVTELTVEHIKPQGSQGILNITAAKTLTNADSGKTCYLNAAAGAAITLPAPKAGLKFKFVTKLAFATTPWTIGTNGGADIIEGTVIVNGASVNGSNEDQIEFDESAESLGDWVELECDGTSWFLSGVGNAAGSIVLTAT